MPSSRHIAAMRPTNPDCERGMARKPTREEFEGEPAEDRSLSRSSVPEVEDLDISGRGTRRKFPQRQSKAEKPEVFKPVGGHLGGAGSPPRRGIIYLDADTLKPIKPPVVVARQLDRADFASNWQGEFGRKLSVARTAVGMSQSDLARKSGVRQPHISKLESGEMEPRLSTIFAIADTLGILARSLFPKMSWQTDEEITNL